MDGYIDRQTDRQTDIEVSGKIKPWEKRMKREFDLQEDLNSLDPTNKCNSKILEKAHFRR